MVNRNLHSSVCIFDPMTTAEFSIASNPTTEKPIAMQIIVRTPDGDAHATLAPAEIERLAIMLGQFLPTVDTIGLPVRSDIPFSQRPRLTIDSVKEGDLVMEVDPPSDTNIALRVRRIIPDYFGNKDDAQISVVNIEDPSDVRVRYVRRFVRLYDADAAAFA